VKPPRQRNRPPRQAGPIGAPGAPATWREALAMLAYRPHLRRTGAIAVVVGTILFCTNQLDVVLRGDAGTVVWVKSAVTYVVPFCVSCAGVLVATRRPPSSTDEPAVPDAEDDAR
jgi:hypothetical protein